LSILMARRFVAVDGVRRVMKPRIPANCWLCIISCLALAVGLLPSPIRTPQRPAVRVYRNLLSGKLVLVASDPGPALKSVRPDRLSIDANHSDPDADPDSDLEEGDDEKPSWLFSHLIGHTFLSSHSPAKLLSSPRLGNSYLCTASLPLRC